MQLTKPFMVAEISSNHHNNYDTLIKTIEAAAEAGADAVKFQTYQPQEMAVDLDIPDGPWAGRNYLDLYKEGMLPWMWHEGAFRHARELGLVPFSTPFSPWAVDRLEKLDCPIYKIASFEIEYRSLLMRILDTGKPLIVSCGMATENEISNVWWQCWKRAADVTFLHCVSAYPAQTADFHLANLGWYKQMGLHFGLSDHSLSNVAAIMAVASGAEIIEKHFTLSRKAGGADAKFSLEPKEFRRLVIDCHDAYRAIGEKYFGPSEAEKTSMQYRRSIWLVEPIKAGEVITPNHLAILRPNHGLPPGCYDGLVGRIAKTDLPRNTPMQWELVE